MCIVKTFVLYTGTRSVNLGKQFRGYNYLLASDEIVSILKLMAASK